VEDFLRANEERNASDDTSGTGCPWKKGNKKTSSVGGCGVSPDFQPAHRNPKRQRGAKEELSVLTLPVAMMQGVAESRGREESGLEPLALNIDNKQSMSGPAGLGRRLYPPATQ
jgi:hypothetical protein